MKHKPVDKKLTLNKTTVVNLTREEQKKAKGGSGTDEDLGCATKGGGDTMA